MSQTPTSGHTHTPAKQKEVPAGPGGVDVAAQNDPNGPGGKVSAEHFLAVAEGLISDP